jgi:hypothetical protein
VLPLDVLNQPSVRREEDGDCVTELLGHVGGGLACRQQESRPDEFGGHGRHAKPGDKRGTFGAFVSDFDPTQSEAIWHLDQSPQARFARLREEAVIEWFDFALCSVIHHDLPIKHRGLTKSAFRGLRKIKWYLKWRYHPELSTREGQKLVWGVPKHCDRIIKKELKKMQLETLAAQSEELLFEVKRLRAEQLEQRALLVETAERVRERFPNDTEVSAAVDRFVAEIGD